MSTRASAGMTEDAVVYHRVGGGRGSEAGPSARRAWAPLRAYLRQDAALAWKSLSPAASHAPHSNGQRETRRETRVGEREEETKATLGGSAAALTSGRVQRNGDPRAAEKQQ